MGYTRITNSYLSSSVFSSTNANQAKLVSLQNQLATGKRVNAPSDDAVAVPSILNTENFLAKVEIYDKNIQNSTSELRVAESTLSSVVSNVQRAYTLAHQASNGINSGSELKIIANEIDELIVTITNLANTSYNDKSIFAGVNIYKPAYDVNGDDIRYDGTDTSQNYQMDIQVKDNLSIPINEAGIDIFGEYYWDAGAGAQVSSGIIGHLKELSSDLKIDPPDYQLIRDKLDVLDGDVQDTLYYQSKYGHLISNLDNIKDQLEREKINAIEFKAGLEDVDLLQVSSDIKFQEIALQASLNSAARVIQPTLLNFLG